MTGAALGLAVCWWQPRLYVGEIVVYFPAVRADLYIPLTKALRTEIEEQTIPASTSPSSDTAAVAALILSSQAARADALNRVGAHPRTVRSLSCLVDDKVSAVKIQVKSSSLDSARGMPQALLDYYSGFVAKQSLSRAAQARTSVEKRLKLLAEELAKLEEQMRRSASQDLRALGDATIGAKKEVMSQIWLKRLEREGRSRNLLAKMSRIRTSQGKGVNPVEETWLADWGGGVTVLPRPAISGVSTRPQDLLKAARLERAYYQALVNYRSLILQQSFWLTMEALETPDYEVVQPLSVEPEEKQWWAFILVGGLLGWFCSLWTGRRGKSR